MAQQPTTRLLAPAFAGVAALVAAGVWMIPGRVLVPNGGAASQTPPTPPAKPAYTPPPKETRWPMLAEKLDALREPWTGPDPTAIVETQQPAVEARIAWEYVGHLSGGGLSTAVVVINGQQRYVNLGESVKDPSYPDKDLKVTEITPQQISVDTGGKEPTSIKRKQAEPPTLRAAQADVMPGSLPNQVIPLPGQSPVASPPRDPARPITRPAAPDNAVRRQKPGAPFNTNTPEQPRPVPGIGPTPASPSPAIGKPSGETPAKPAVTPIRPGSTKPGGIK